MWDCHTFHREEERGHFLDGYNWPYCTVYRVHRQGVFVVVLTLLDPPLKQEFVWQVVEKLLDQ